MAFQHFGSGAAGQGGGVVGAVIGNHNQAMQALLTDGTAALGASFGDITVEKA